RSSFAPRTAFEGSAHVDAVGRLGRLEVTPGMRVELYTSQGHTFVAADPRFSAPLGVTPDLRVVIAAGLASQPPRLVSPLPGVDPTLDRGLQRSFQSSAGVEVDLPGAVRATATVYSTLFYGVTDPLGQLRNVDTAVAFGAD